jgi:hypothetical protein
MKAKDIKTDVVYAYRTSDYDPPVPVRVLDAGRMYYFTNHARFAKREAGTPMLAARERGGMAAGDGYGMVALTPFQGLRGNGWDVDPALFENPHLTLLRPTITQVLTLTTDQVTAHQEKVPGTETYIVTLNPRYVVGEWETVWEQYQDGIEQKRLDREAKDAREKANAERVWGLIDRVKATGIKVKDPKWGRARSMSNTNVTLSADALEALLDLIPEGATVPTEDEQWEYAEPEGR